jgi:hypothetical protein
MNDGYQTGDLALACALLYIYSEDALTRIERDPVRGQTFHLDIASLDGYAYADDFQKGQLAISDLKAYQRTYDFMVRRLKTMRNNGEMSWCSPSWVNGQTSTGRSIR